MHTTSLHSHSNSLHSPPILIHLPTTLLHSHTTSLHSSTILLLSHVTSFLSIFFAFSHTQEQSYGIGYSSSSLFHSVPRHNRVQGLFEMRQDLCFSALLSLLGQGVIVWLCLRVFFLSMHVPDCALCVLWFLFSLRCLFGFCCFFSVVVKWRYQGKYPEKPGVSLLGVWSLLYPALSPTFLPPSRLLASPFSTAHSLLPMSSFLLFAFSLSLPFLTPCPSPFFMFPSPRLLLPRDTRNRRCQPLSFSSEFWTLACH